MGKYDADATGYVPPRSEQEEMRAFNARLIAEEINENRRNKRQPTEPTPMNIDMLLRAGLTAEHAAEFAIASDDMRRTFKSVETFLDAMKFYVVAMAESSSVRLWWARFGSTAMYKFSLERIDSNGVVTGECTDPTASISAAACAAPLLETLLKNLANATIETIAARDKFAVMDEAAP